MRAYGGVQVGYKSILHYMEVRDQLDAPVALPPGNGLSLLIELEAWWPSE